MKKLLALWIIMATASASWANDPACAIVLGSRHAHGTPHRKHCGRTGGGNIHVAQPSPDVVVITMTGAVAAVGHPFHESHAGMDFDLAQKFKIIATNPKKPIAAKLFMDIQVVGLLRSGGHCENSTARDGGGAAQQGLACASVGTGHQALLSLCVDPHGVGCRDKLSINCQKGPICADVPPGCYELHGRFAINASHKRSLLPCRPASAEFASGALAAQWLGHADSFRGAAKGDFGYRITLRVVGEELPAAEFNAIVENSMK